MKLQMPPLFQFLVCAALGWMFTAALPSFQFNWTGVGVMGWLIMGIGTAILLISVRAFISVRTTVNPLDPSKANSLVTTGLYRISRNPMYLAMALILFGEAFLLGSWVAFAAPILFVVAMTLLQIKPEEKALQEIFGNDFLEYCRRTRRWI